LGRDYEKLHFLLKVMATLPECIRDISKTGRRHSQLANHYLVEKKLADQLRISTRAERLNLFPELYGELFRQVPDHPRLTRRVSDEESAKTVAARKLILQGKLTPETIFMEIAPGDCKLACEVAKDVKKVYAADISDQREPGMHVQDNFEMVVFDGLNLDIEPQSVDVAFSYQFLEHLHPDDVDPHFDLVAKALKQGGVYILDTPHAFSGPHDISRFFSEKPEGFHMHEWTYRELKSLGNKHGFNKMFVYRFGRRWDNSLFTFATLCIESVVGYLPKSIAWKLSQRLFLGVTVCLVKS
jgi:SAM-dependent methyltransferase